MPFKVYSVYEDYFKSYPTIPKTFVLRLLTIINYKDRYSTKASSETEFNAFYLKT